MDSSDNILSSTSEDNDVVSEWVVGLPTAEELTPLSQPLITPQLASGFSVTPEPNKTILDVHRASQETISTLRCRQGVSSSSSSSALKKFPSLTAPSIGQDEILEVVDEEEEELGIEEDNTVYMMDGGEIGGSLATDEDIGDKGSSKRPRLVWTAQLHKRFVDVVKHLGIKNAVPKTIMQLMNVEGLTRENVASHLQKYRLYLKRINGVPSDDDTSPSDHPFSGMPVPQNMREAPAPVPMPVPVPYVMPPRGIPMPVYGLPHEGNGGGMGMLSPNGQLANGSYRGFAAQHPYAVFGPRPGGWPDGKQPGSNASTSDAAQSDK